MAPSRLYNPPGSPINHRMQPDRRLFLGVFCTLPAACVSLGDRREPGTPIAAPADAAVRPPAIGQRWVYEVRDLYRNMVVDTVTEAVIAVSPDIRLQRTSARHGALAEEVQRPWGMIAQDPHWDPPVVFLEPIAAWPQLPIAAGTSKSVHARYHTLRTPDFDMPWYQTMHVLGWESITVPAGTFDAVRYHDAIDFTSNDFNRTESFRSEVVWFAPRIGRWVLRRSQGSYFTPNRGGPMVEPYLQWKLVSWA